MHLIILISNYTQFTLLAYNDRRKDLNQKTHNSYIMKEIKIN